MNKRNFHDISLGIVTPMANENATAIDFVNEVLTECGKYEFKSIVYHVIFDNICTDGTYEMLKDYAINEPRLNVVFAPDNKCVVDAYVKGYAEAYKSNCDWVLEIDAGFSHQTNEIERFFNKMVLGYDCVFGSRFIKDGKYKNAPLSRYILSRGGSILVNLIMGTKLKDMTSGFELFSSRVIGEILDEDVIRSRNTFFQTEIRTYCHKFNIAEIPITYSNPSIKSTGSALGDALKSLLSLRRFKSEINKVEI